MKMLICDGMHQSGLELLQQAAGLEVDCPKQPSAEQVAEIIADYDALVVRSRTKVTAALIERAKKLKVIGRAGTGVDNIDIGAASSRGILVMNTPGANAMAAAEHTLAMMLALSRHIPQATQSLREGRWDKKQFMGTELYHQTLGVIGLGRIGSIVADRALGMKMLVLSHDPHILPETAAIMGTEWVSLEELLARSDYITLHVPKTAETENVINREAIARMKPGVRIINCARGGLLDERALYEGLVEGKIAGAALDVFAEEPPTGNPLLQLPNAIFTPHLGASSVQAQANVARAIAGQILDYLQQGVIRNALNFPSISPKAHEKIKPYMLLAERLAHFQGQLCRQLQRVEIEYSGTELTELPLPPLTQTIAKGLLDPILAEQVNLVNAPLLMEQRKIKLVSTKTSESHGYTGLITLKVHGQDLERSATGAVFPGNEIRLIRLNTYRLEAELEGVNLLIQNLDKPGVIGFIGSTLGDHQVNIANMHLSRTPERDRAIAIIRLDAQAPEPALTALRNHPSILSVEQVIL
ncbi:MAG: phosphoglycerate dehydrogenase [Syntrophobacteraceae bacterium CG2_30_61_12]|nr:MAG: phosphoglycerate dehydrogenase [Syntrophobacteraceae bacterium CG2_30_61_12]